MLNTGLTIARDRTRCHDHSIKWVEEEEEEEFYTVSSYNENGHVVAPVTAVAQQRRSLSFSHLRLYERSGTLRAVTLCPPRCVPTWSGLGTSAKK